MTVRLNWVYLGLQPYGKALQMQRRLARAVASDASRSLLVFLQHPPVVTLGRRSTDGQLLLTPRQLRERGVEVVHVDRGGGATFHGPGQLVGYPVARLDAFRVGVHDWVQGHARALARVLAAHGIEARWSELHPGLWVGNDKIAALGFHIERRVSTHGFAMNVDVELGYFETIVPCGLAHRGVTSMARQGVAVPLPQLAREVAAAVAESFSVELGDELPASVCEGGCHDRTQACC